MGRIWTAALMVAALAGCPRRPLTESADAGITPDGMAGPVAGADAFGELVRDTGLERSGQPDARDAAAGGADAADNCADGGPSPGARSWLDDSCLWEPVPGLETCDVRQARLPSPLFPRRVFSSCGDGCRTTGAHVDGSYGLMAMPRGFSDGQSSYVRIFTGLDRRDIREIIDVTRGETVAAFQTRNAVKGSNWQQCGPWPSQDLGPVDVESWYYWTGSPNASNNPTSIFYARSRYRESKRLDVVPGAFVVPGDPITTPSLYDIGRLAVNDTHWGYFDAHSLNGLHASDDWTKPPPFPSVADAPDREHTFTDLSGWGSTFIWQDYLEAGGLYAWSPADGARVVARSDGRIYGSAIAATGVVWLVPHGTQKDANGTIWVASEDLWWVPDLAAPQPVRVATGIGPVPPPGLVTGDGLAAMVSCDVSKNPPLRPADCALVVVALTTGKVWALGLPATGMYWARPSVVNARELVVGAFEDHPFLIEAVRSLYVLDVSRLDELQALFPAAAVRPMPAPPE